MVSSQGRYPYPSIINIVNFISLKLTQTNYLLWKTQIVSLIERQDLEGFIYENTPMPKWEIDSDDRKNKISNPDYMSWIKSNKLEKAWLTSIFSEEVLWLSIGFTTSFDAWRALENAFAQIS